MLALRDRGIKAQASGLLTADGAGGDLAVILTLADAPTIAGESKALRGLHGHTKDGPVLPLPNGWEPHWTYAEIAGKK